MIQAMTAGANAGEITRTTEMADRKNMKKFLKVSNFGGFFVLDWYRAKGHGGRAVAFLLAVGGMGGSER